MGEPRHIRDGVKVTAFNLATSEIRRRDRRCATPNKILYMAMKLLRLRVVEGITETFRSTSFVENVTRKNLEDKNFLNDALVKNFAFLKTVPNSVQYWGEKKKDLFAMMRQLGKPTVFLTMSANEIGWPKLMEILHSLSQRFPDQDWQNLNKGQKTSLVCEDPVVCCIYFKRLVDHIMTILGANSPNNPFGKFYVKDSFIRFEFQNRGSPHAHIILWLNDDPAEKVCEDMPNTIKFIDSLFSVNSSDLPEEDMIIRQTHKHTFTCTKRGEKSCRFKIPFWPSEDTTILIPLASSDPRRQELRLQAAEIRQNLENRQYQTIPDFFKDNSITSYKSYLNLIRSTLTRPTVLLKRNMDQIHINSFHPWIAGVLNSNMDIQFILDEYSCAAYVVGYVNKTERGMGNLRRQMQDLSDQNPDADHLSLMKMVSIKFLNAIEMTSQEASWFLLRQNMSHFSRDVKYIPTGLPSERHKYRKTKKCMDAEGLADDSRDVWTFNIIEKYEDRPPELENVYLAEFVSDYVQQTKTKEYKKRAKSIIIRYNQYKSDDLTNFTREMVLLFIPFRSEIVDILDRDKFKEVYNENTDLIMSRRKIYEANINIDGLLAEIEALMNMGPDDDPQECSSPEIVRIREEGLPENNDDIFKLPVPVNKSISAVGHRTQVMSAAKYCAMMRTTNARQKELLLEAIHRIHCSTPEPLQIFFTGPAGCGKTYTIKLLMETYNRFTQSHKSNQNAYLVCGTTGKDECYVFFHN